jgi:Na+/serine symporter
MNILLAFSACAIIPRFVDQCLYIPVSCSLLSNDEEFESSVIPLRFAIQTVQT